MCDYTLQCLTVQIASINMAAAITLALLAGGAAAEFNPLHHLGGNSPYFTGPNVFSISPDPPADCVVDQAAFSSRHGARYPDPAAYDQWQELAAKVRELETSPRNFARDS